jgi:septal ring factor EnvC (AmiA/AmiB activator)
MKTGDFGWRLILRNWIILLRYFQQSQGAPLLRMEPRAMSPSEASEQHAAVHSSPARVLARFFEKSRDRWKAKYVTLQERVKVFRTEVRDLRRSRDRWRAKAEALEQKIEELQQHVEQSPPAPSRVL